ncbi:hypothetical protein L7F22_000513 [Adiantum nelumboides]|nr:hypothetical protein [Adiantum nelumboides]
MLDAVGMQEGQVNHELDQPREVVGSNSSNIAIERGSLMRAASEGPAHERRLLGVYEARKPQCEGLVRDGQELEKLLYKGGKPSEGHQGHGEGQQYKTAIVQGSGLA